MKDPEDLLGVLKDLIRDDQVGLTICKRQGVTLDVSNANLVSFAHQVPCVFPSSFYCDECGLWMKSSDDLQIPPRARPQIDYDLKIAQLENKFLYNVGTVCFTLVSKAAQRMGSARTAEQRLHLFGAAPITRVLNGTSLFVKNDDHAPIQTVVDLLKQQRSPWRCRRIGQGKTPKSWLVSPIICP